MLTTILTNIIQNLVLLAITGIAGWVGKHFVSKLKIQMNQIKNEEDRALINDTLSIAQKSVEDAVGQVNQTLVDNLKQASPDGKLTPDQIKLAFGNTLELSKSIMGNATYLALQQLTPDVELWITTKIENAVRLNKSAPTNTNQSVSIPSPVINNTTITNP